MARNIASTRSSANTRTTPTYPKTPVGGVYIPGAKSIEGATGDTARTTTGWIENQKYGWYLYVGVANCSAEFDTAVTKTGTRTVLLQTTDATGSGSVSMHQSISATVVSSIRPNISYTLSCWVKTSDAANGTVYITARTLNAAKASLTSNNSSTLSGTNDWTLLTKTFTSDATAAFVNILLKSDGGATSNAWFDVNSMTLIDNTVSRNAVV